MDNPLFDPIPEDLSQLTSEQLEEALSGLLAVEQRLSDQDEDLLAGRTNQEVIDGYTELVVAIEAIRGEQTARAEEAETTRAAMDELHARATAEPETPEPETDEGDEPGEGEPETGEAEADAEAEAEAEQELPIAASTRPFQFGQPAERRPRVDVDEPRRATIVAAGGLADRGPGAEMSPKEMADAFVKVMMHGGKAQPGVSVNQTVASVYAEYPPERILDTKDEVETWEKIERVIGGAPGSPKQRAALAASGGICSPSQINYAIDVLGVTDRPVRDSLPSFQATRGGIRYVVPPTIGDVDASAISAITSAEDTAGGSGATKSCWHVDCPEFTEVKLNILAQCLEFGNLTSRTYPEMVTAWQQLTGIVYAQTTETALLDAIATGSTAVTMSAAPLGAYGTLVEAFIRAAAAFRSRFRLNRDVVLRALLPEWVIDLMIADAERSQFYRGSLDAAGVIAAFRRANVAVGFYLDQETGTSQVFGAQNAGLLLPWPSHVTWFLFTEGTWLYLDGGQLDLGIVRDSTLNSTNDYQMFSEEFHNVAQVGHQSLKVTTPICATGETAGPVDVTCGS